MTGQQQYGSRVEINLLRLTRACERQLLNNDPVEDFKFEAMFDTMEIFLKQLREIDSVDESLSGFALTSYKEKISALRDLAAMRTAQPVTTPPTTPVSATQSRETTQIPKDSDVIENSCEIDHDNENQTATKMLHMEPLIQQSAQRSDAVAFSTHNTLAELASIEREQLFQDSSFTTSQGSLRRRGGVNKDKSTNSVRDAVEQVEEEENKPVLEDVGNLVSELKQNASALQQEVKSADKYFEQMDASVNLNRATMSKENDTMKTMIKESSMSWWFYIFTTLIVLVVFMALFIFIRTAPNLSGQYSS